MSRKGHRAFFVVQTELQQELAWLETEKAQAKPPETEIFGVKGSGDLRALEARESGFDSHLPEFD